MISVDLRENSAFKQQIKEKILRESTEEAKQRQCVSILQICLPAKLTNQF